MSYGARRFIHKSKNKGKGTSKVRNKTARKDKPKFTRLTLNGIKYCNELELRVAKLLTDHGILFEYSKKFYTADEFGNTVDEHGNKKYREVDFWLPVPIEIFWCDEPVQAIEVKGGKLDDRCWFQKKELRGVGVKTWIATPRYVTFWEYHGFLRSNGLYKHTGRKRS